ARSRSDVIVCCRKFSLSNLRSRSFKTCVLTILDMLKIWKLTISPGKTVDKEHVTVIQHLNVKNFDKYTLCFSGIKLKR
ncbi:hypothetical protein L9F63_009280, partial [Diploptera punctata]